jgi:hypothetical protein
MKALDDSNDDTSAMIAAQLKTAQVCVVREVIIVFPLCSYEAVCWLKSNNCVPGKKIVFLLYSIKQ